jgi:glycosyltransferase involved in cell wall biosynthesis
VIVGDGPARNELRRRAPENVVFTGYLSGTALAATYASADVFAFPSDTETFGNVVLEAMASGLPVVCVDRGGVSEVARNGRNGLVTRAGDVAQFARAILQLLDDDGLRLRLGRNARQDAVERSWSRIFADLFAAYDEVAGAQTTRAA